MVLSPLRSLLPPVLRDIFPRQATKRKLQEDEDVTQDLDQVQTQTSNTQIRSPIVLKAFTNNDR